MRKMSWKLWKIVFFLSAMVVFSQNLFAQSEKNAAIESISPLPFALNLPLDITISALGAAGWGYRLYKSHTESAEDWDGTLYDKSDINAFDRWAAQSYSETLDNLGTVGCALAIAPALYGVYASNDWITTGVMFAETMLFASGTYSALKTVVERNRPYMYFSGGSDKDMDEGDYKNSFPSGHTTNAFAAATFACYVFSAYNGDSKLKIPVCATALTLASATGVLRVMSGNHFPSDVLAGAVLGSASGFLVPFLHRTDLFSKNVEVAALPAGFYAKVKF